MEDAYPAKIDVRGEVRSQVCGRDLRRVRRRESLEDTPGDADQNLAHEQDFQARSKERNENDGDNG